MENPFFSIVIITYNRSHFILTAINSVINQSYTDWELIIIDDGSSDDTESVILPFLKDSRIKYFYQSHQKKGVARNNGIKRTTGEYLCFLDDDDYYLENHLTTFKKYIELTNFPQKTIFYSERTIKDGDEYKKIPYSYYPSENKTDNLIYFGLLEAPANINTCIHRSFQNEVLFDEIKWVFYVPLYHFILRLLLKDYKLYRIEEYTSVILQHGNQMTSDSYKFFKGRYDYIVYFSNLLKLDNHPLIKKKKLDFLTAIIQCSDNLPDKIKTTFKLIKISPKIIFYRRFWGVIKNIFQHVKTRLFSR